MKNSHLTAIIVIFCSLFTPIVPSPEKAQTSDLTWYNKAARALDSYIVTPVNRYDISKTVTSVACGCIIYSLIGYFTPTTEIYKTARAKYPLVTLSAIGLGLALHKIAHNEVIQEKLEHYWDLLRGGEYLNKPRYIMPMESDVTFDDMIDVNDVKHYFSNIISFLDSAEQFTRLAAAPTRFLLLTGPSATGKSFSVHCLCGEAKKRMAKQGTPDKIKFFQVYPGTFTKEIFEKLIQTLKKNTPTVIFFDDLDQHLGISRGNPAEKLFISFLVALQNSIEANALTNVVVIAATQYPETIDKSLRYNTNFTQEIRFDYPSQATRLAFISNKLTKMGINIEDLDVQNIVDKTDGMSLHQLSYTDLTKI